VANLVPFYLDPNSQIVNVPPSESIFDIKIDPTYIQYPGSKSFWQEMAEVPSEAGQFVYSSVEGVWKSAKESVLGAADFASDLVDSAGNKLGSVFTYLRDNLIILFVVLIGGIYLVAKSGILTQVAKLK
jgi:hypothetical protein